MNERLLTKLEMQQLTNVVNGNHFWQPLGLYV